MASQDETDKQIEIWKVKRVRQMLLVLLVSSASCRQQLPESHICVGFKRS